LVRLDHSSVETTSAKRMSRPPIVGVPALMKCACGPTSRMFWPTDRRRSVRMNHGPRRNEMASAVTAAIAARKVM
jgi:hypothetical protein